MYHKLIIKIRVASFCIMILGVILSTLIGVAIINDLQELIGFLIIFIGSSASVLISSLLSYICDILDKFYHTLQKTKNCNKTVSKE